LNLRAPTVWCLIAALLFGASTPLAKLLLADIGPFVLAGLLYVGAAFAVFPAAVSGGPMLSGLRGRNLRLLCGAIVFGGIAGPVLLLEGLRRAPAGSVSLWLNLETTATALLAWLFFKEDMGRRVWLAIGLVGVAGVALAWPFEPSSVQAVGLVVAACFCWGAENNFTALIDGLTPSQSTFLKGAVAGLVNLAVGVGLAGEISSLGSVSDSLFAALALGGLCYGVSLALYVRGAQQLGAARSQLIFSAAPFFGLTLSWVLLGEPVLRLQVVAGALMAAGMGLMLGARHEHGHHHSAQTHTHDHRHDDGHHDHTHEDLPAGVRHTHEHSHPEKTHSHPHRPDLHHRHDHPPAGSPPPEPSDE
jgi:drug/metabolite transporter (DMT)-like permease